MSRPLLEQLDRTAGKIRSSARATTVGATVAAALAAATALVLIDWLGRLDDPGLRWLFTATLLAATAAAGWAGWRRWRPTDATRLGVAQRLQTIRPDLGSRLASAVEFAESDAEDRGAGSAELRRAVVLEATHSADDLPYGEVIDRAPRRRAVRWLLASAAALAAFGVANPSALSSGLLRLAAPWAEAPWPREVVLRVVDPPETLARGARFEATVINERGGAPPDTRIEYRFPSDGDLSARDETAPAQLVGDQAVATRESVQRSFSYRFLGGDDDTMGWIELAVLDPPRAESLEVSVQPPAYSGLSPTTSSGPLRVLAGSEIALNGETDKPLQEATLELPGQEPSNLLFRETGADDPRGFKAIPWVAQPTEATSTYELRLTGLEGVTGVEGPHRYEVLADTPPALEWESSAPEVVVTSRTLIALKGTAIDDLAIRRVEAEWAPADDDDQNEPQRFLIEESSEEPPARESLSGADERTIAYDWDLADLGLEAGDELMVALVAADYQPAEGRTAEARRVVVVSDDDYRARLAEAQSRLLGQVQQALAAQREANDATRSLGVDTRNVDTVGREEIDRLTSIEYQQREAAAAVDEPTTGAAAQARNLLDDLRRSRLEAEDLETQLSAAGDALQRLAENELPGARSDLASSRRAAQRADEDREAKDEFRKRLGEAYVQQQSAAERLEQVADLLTSWADYQRFAGEAAALEQLQRDLASESQRQAAASASKLMVDPTQAEREKLISGQAEAGRRFDRLRQAMKKLLASQPDESESTAAQSVGDALAEADDANVSGRQRDAARDLARGKLGAASEQQEAAAEGLRAMVEALRQQAITDPEELAKRLRAEKERLAELQDQVEALKQRPDTRSTRAAREQTGERAERLSRRLDRFTAPQAAASASQGGQQAGGQQQPGRAQEQLAQAQESFEQAQREIDQRLNQLENQRTQRLLDQLTAKIGGYIERQETVLDETLGLATLRNPRERRQGASALAVDERDLADELSGFAELLAKRAVFELALSGASGQAESAADRLERAKVDRQTQRFETAALARLKQIQDVLRQEQEDRQQQEQNGGGGQGGQGGQRPPPSPIDVAELKMLRLMQMEVLDETDAYEADTAAARRSRQPLPPAWEAAGRELAERQRRLAELALELAERDNDPEADAPPE